MLIEERDESIVQTATTEKTPEVFHFEKLAPINNANIDIYEDAINFVFENPDLKNIAISGAYGSGKSSLLASYKAAHPEKKFIHISLAHFEPDSTDKELKKKDGESNPFFTTEDCISDGGNRSSRESILEGKILNQLIHQIEETSIPQTNFRIKNSLSKKQIYQYACTAILYFVTVIHLVFSYTWINFVSTFSEKSILKSILELTTTPFSFFLSGCIGLGIISTYVYSTIKRQRFRATIRKLSLQGNDIELFENNTDSFFDKYLNEVLYLFENSDVDGIVFEDMDRYELEGIFERLREINTLANIRLSNKDKVIRFFFLLRDDLFVSKDRTKFFDIIIPVVPVVDSSNSYDQLIGHMKKNGFEGKFKDSFLQGLSLYIDDMRLLKNICNEFLIYYKRLNSTELDINKMLAIIAYKNIFPRDFSQLQVNQGFVYALFTSKDSFIQKKKTGLQEKIDEIDSQMESMKKEHLISLREVDAVFVDMEGNYSIHHYGDAQFSDWLKRNISSKNRKAYEQRRQNLEAKLSDGLIACERHKEDIKLEIQKLNQKRLAEIIDRDNINTIFSVKTKNALNEETDYQDVKRNQYFDLLKYLVRNGYIDESYSDYMTYFYPNSLTTTDKVFLQSVTNKVAKAYSHPLKKPELVFSKLSTRDFDEEETLNFCLLSYMLKKPEAEECLQHLIVQIRTKKQFEFISQYLDSTCDKAGFVKSLNAQWPEFFSIALRESIIPLRQIWDYSHDTLIYSSNEIIAAVNIEDCLRNYIGSQPDFLNIHEGNIGALFNGLLLINVKFETIDYPHVNQLLFRHVYDKSCYVLNFNNIALMLSYDYGIEDQKEIRHKNYTLIISQEHSPLCCYVRDEIEEYVDVMLAFCDEHIVDCETAALDLLNNSQVTCQQKQQYISYLESQIIKLNDVQDTSLWTELLEEGVIVYSDQNLVDYWMNSKSFDTALVNFINNSGQDISVKSIESQDKDLPSKMFNQIVETTQIDNVHYIQMLKSLNRYYGRGFGFEDIPDEKMKLLFDYDIIRMTEDNLKDIRKNYPSVLYYFIRINFEEYLEILTVQLLVHEEVLEILTWEVTNEAKLALLKLSKAPISIINKDYTEEITAYILQNRLEPKDIPVLYANYPSNIGEVQSFVVSYAEKQIDSIISGNVEANERLKIRLLASENIDLGKKYKLLLAMLPYISKNNCKLCFDAIGLTEFSKIFETYAKPKIQKTENNQKILDAMIARGWLYDYRESPQDSNFYMIRRKEPNKKRSTE